LGYKQKARFCQPIVCFIHQAAIELQNENKDQTQKEQKGEKDPQSEGHYLPPHRPEPENELP
jgi:hypothetical protein